jgi:hypothetical protein
VHVVARGLDRGEHRGIGRLAVLEGLGAVADAERGLGQRLFDGDMALEQAGIRRALPQVGEDALALGMRERHARVLDAHRLALLPQQVAVERWKGGAPGEGERERGARQACDQLTSLGQRPS